MAIASVHREIVLSCLPYLPKEAMSAFVTERKRGLRALTHVTCSLDTHTAIMKMETALILKLHSLLWLSTCCDFILRCDSYAKCELSLCERKSCRWPSTQATNTYRYIVMTRSSISRLFYRS